MRENLYDTLSGPLAKLWEQLAAADQELREYALTARDRFAQRIAADLTQQWAWLTREGALAALTRDTFNDHTRFLRGFRERLRRIREQPAAKELERIESVAASVNPAFAQEYANHPRSAAWLAYGLLVQEFRLTVFAPALALKGRASIKKLQAAAAALA